MAKEIVLTQGKVTIVDDEDFEWLNQWKWSVMKNRCYWYAQRQTKHGGPVMLMHRLILDVPKGMCIDHVDGDGLNNQRRNLRVCTNTENVRKQRIHSCVKASKFKGVFWNMNYERWETRITVNRKHIYLGRYEVEQDAAEAYDAAAFKYFGEFAYPNFPRSRDEISSIS